MPNRARITAALDTLAKQLADPDKLAHEAAYRDIRDGFDHQLTGSVTEFMGGANRRASVNAAKRTVVEAYGQVADIFGPLEPGDLAKFNQEVADELDYVENLFGDLAVRRTAGDSSVPADRLAQYNRSIDALYNELAASARKRVKVYWERGATEHGCTDCSRLDGQEHTLGYYLQRNFIPRKPGAAMQCGGHKCDCKWKDANGNEINVGEGD